MRSPKRLADIRKLPCVRCGHPDSQAAHSNWAEHGKGRGVKADDAYTIPLCVKCHQWLDQYQYMNRDESKVWFMQMLSKVDRMLNQTDKEIF